MKTDYKKVNEFLKNDNLPIDHIFSELDDLYRDIDKENGKILSEEVNDGNNGNNETEEERKKKEKERKKLLLKNVRNKMKTDISSAKGEYERNFKEAKEEFSKELTESQLERERKKQIEINRKLEEELYNSTSNIQDRENYINAYQHPSQYMRTNQVSTAVIPRDQRNDMVAVDPNSNSNSGSVLKTVMGCGGMALGGAQKLSTNMYMLNSLLMLPTLAMSVGTILFFTIPKFIINGVWGVFSPKQDLENRIVRDKEGQVLLTDPGVAAFNTENKKPLKSFGFDEKNNLLNQAVKSYNSIVKSENKLTIKKILNLSPTSKEMNEIIETIRTSTKTEDIGLVRELTTKIYNNFNNSLNTNVFDNAKNIMQQGFGFNWYTLQTFIGYGIVIIVIYFILKFFYNMYKKYTERKEKEQYARINKVSIQEISLELLYEESLDIKKNFHELELLEESILSNIAKKFSPSPKTLLKYSTKSSAYLLGLTKITKIGRDVVDPRMMKLSNRLIGTMNNAIGISRGAILSGMK